MPTSPVKTFTRNRLMPAIAGLPHPTISIKLPANKTFSAGQVLAELIGNNEVQTVTPPGSSTFTTTLGGQTTSAVAFNATAATYQAALEALSTIGVGNVSVTGGGGSAFVVTFQNALGNTNIALMTVSAGSVAETTAGSAGTPGTFDSVDLTLTNGRQLPKVLLEWDAETDANGKLKLENDRTAEQSSAYVGGAFNTADLTGLTAAVLAARTGARILQGTLATATPGIIQW